MEEVKFITQDGVELKSGDIMYVVSGNDIMEIKIRDTNPNFFKQLNGFSTKELAKNNKNMKEIKGDLIKLARQGEFDIIAHGCNCFCRMGSGIAKQVAIEIPDAVKSDNLTKPGDINKLGNYTVGVVFDYESNPISIIYNCYTQYGHNPKDKPLVYEALTLCLRKINFNNKGKSIGLPLLGAGLAGGDWNKIKEIIRQELKDMDVTIVHFEK